MLGWKLEGFGVLVGGWLTGLLGMGSRMPKGSFSEVNCLF